MPAACIPCATAAVANPIIAPIAAISYAAYRLSNGRKGSKMRKKMIKKSSKKRTRRKYSKKYSKKRKSSKKRLRKLSKKRL